MAEDKRTGPRDGGDIVQFCAEVQAALNDGRRFGEFISVRPGFPRATRSPQTGDVVLEQPTVNIYGIDRAHFYEVMGFLASSGPEKPALDYPPVRRLLAPKRRPRLKPARKRRR